MQQSRNSCRDGNLAQVRAVQPRRFFLPNVWRRNQEIRIIPPPWGEQSRPIAFYWQHFHLEAISINSIMLSHKVDTTSPAQLATRTSNENDIKCVYVLVCNAKVRKANTDPLRQVLELQRGGKQTKEIKRYHSCSALFRGWRCWACWFARQRRIDSERHPSSSAQRRG